jgi:hypothetical protein
MTHRTFRSLDDAPKLVGFTLRQWALLIAGSGLVLAVVRVAQLPAKPAITLCVFTVGLPAALTFVSESGGLQLGLLLRDMCLWRLRGKTLHPCSRAQRARAGVQIVAGNATAQPARSPRRVGDVPGAQSWRERR